MGICGNGELMKYHTDWRYFHVWIIWFCYPDSLITIKLYDVRRQPYLHIVGTEVAESVALLLEKRS